MRGALVVCVLAGCGRVDFDHATDARSDTGQGTPDAAIPAGAVLWLPMDEPLKTTTLEDVAGGHIVTCAPLASCPSPVAGIHGGALHFDGGSMSFAQAIYASDLDASAGYTVGAWVRFDDLAAEPFSCIVSKQLGTVDLDSYALCVATSGDAIYYSNNGPADAYLNGPPIALGEWHHLAMVWDGTTKIGFLDGLVAGSQPAAIGSDASPIEIGADINGTSSIYHVNGAIDDVVIYRRALTLAEVGLLATP